MRNHSYAQQKVTEIVNHLPGAIDVLRTYGIDATSQLSLVQAAIVAAVEVDEVLAALELKAQQLTHVDTSAARTYDTVFNIDESLKPM